MNNPILGVTLGIVAAFAVLLVLYLYAEKKNDGKKGFIKATTTKLILSGIFCAAGIISYFFFINTSQFAPGHMPPQLLVLLGLFFAFAGDYFLQYIRLNAKKYITGICCFAAAQILFISALVIKVPGDGINWLLTVVITVAVLLCVLAMMKKQNWQLGKEKNVLTIYTVFLTFMTAKAVASLTGGVTAGTLLFAAGAVLFLLSDVLLGIWNYNTGKRVHANLNWISYYSGMILIALSIYY